MARVISEELYISQRIPVHIENVWILEDTYSEQRRFILDCASAQSNMTLRCSLILKYICSCVEAV